jgi:hypothetical protein
LGDEGVPRPNPIDQEISSAIIKAHFHQKAQPIIQSMNVKRNANGAITAITQPNAIGAIALGYCEVMINAARMVDMGVIDAEENLSWGRLKVHVVPLVR